MGWIQEFKLKDVFSPMWESLQRSVHSADWITEISVGGFVEDVKKDIASGAKSVKGFFTIPAIWIVGVLILILIIIFKVKG